MIARLVLALYKAFAARKTTGLWFLGLILAAAPVALTQLKPVENVASLMPDGSKGLSQDFRLLQKAPLSQMVMIDVSTESPEIKAALIEAADALAGTLDRNIFPDVQSGPEISDPSAFLSGLLDLMPALFTERDKAELETRLDQASVRTAMASCLRALVSPESLGMTQVWRKDPLGLRQLVLAKLRYLNLTGTVAVDSGHFASRDGWHVLLFARPAGKMTDVQASARIVEAFEQACQVLPQGVHATMLSGHRHTLANAKAIRQDMFTVLVLSSLGLLGICLVGMRSHQALFVFALPLAILAPAALVTWAVFGTLSAITLGFGSVLMGVAVDYGIYVYFAVRGLPGPVEDSLKKVFPAVWYGASTTLVCFAALFTSSIPGVRELAFFSITGLCLAFLLAFVALPTVLTPQIRTGIPQRSVGSGNSLTPGQAWLVVALVLAAAVFFGPHLRFDTDIRNLNAVDATIKRDEEQLQKVWGNPMGRAMVFARGTTLDQALTANAAFFNRSVDLGIEDNLSSLAPLLPPAEVQKENVARWRAFWTLERIDVLRTLVREAAQPLPFKPDAFDPFWSLLNPNTPHPPASFAALEKLGLGQAFRMLVTQDDRETLILSLTGDDPVRAEVADACGPSVRYISRLAFAREMGSLLQTDFLRFILVALGANILLLLVFFRSVRLAALALTPTLVAMAFLVAAFGAADSGLTLFGVVALPLIIGIGVDYGIFMVLQGVGPLGFDARRAVLLAGLTTMVGFGSLTAAKHPALFSIGQTVMLGVLAAVFAACVLLPAFRRRR